jgi:hypothetical protein
MNSDKLIELFLKLPNLKSINFWNWTELHQIDWMTSELKILLEINKFDEIKEKYKN